MAHANDIAAVDWSKWQDEAPPATHRFITVKVDASGYPLPLLDSAAQEVEAAHAQPAPDTASCTLSFIADGEMPAELVQQLQAAELSLKARYIPPVPHWLAQAPPQWATVLPDGEVLTQGELGSGKGLDTFCTWDAPFNLPPQPYCRYSAQGQLLGRLEQGDEDWYKLFWPEAQQALSRYQQQTLCDFDYGCISVYPYASNEVLAVFNYDGAPLPVDTEPDTRDRNVWDGWYGQEIALLYAVQQAALASGAAQ